MSNQYMFEIGDRLDLSRICDGLTGVIIDRWCLNGRPHMPPSATNEYRYRIERSDGDRFNYDESSLISCRLIHTKKDREELKNKPSVHRALKFCVIGEGASGYVGRRNWYTTKEEAALHGVDLLRKQNAVPGTTIHVVQIVAMVVTDPAPITVKDVE
jgi:hypothetical protein